MKYRAVFTLSAGILIHGCATNPDVPVTDRSSASQPEFPNTSYRPLTGKKMHIVESGDTLFSIAWGAGLDFQVLAGWNRIDPPYIIRPGQRLTLVPSRVNLSKNAVTPKPKPAKKSKIISPQSSSQSSPQNSSGVQDQPFAGGAGGWVWPVKGPILKGYSASGSNKGIDIGGTRGHGVRAAASGKVVYAGSGLRGYGQLIIVKHDEVYLSAYAHNSKLLVEDGQRVSKGQQIALMGDSGTDRVKLHFEIRQRGKPVDPLKFLPTRP
ncbi:peptidoglycan DD-metalloendopeptidase family protein [Pseudomonadota bacterium]